VRDHALPEMLPMPVVADDCADDRADDWSVRYGWA
jgi:hypothetical protein